jgi:hypothetical protein
VPSSEIENLVNRLVKGLTKSVQPYKHIQAIHLQNRHIWLDLDACVADSCASRIEGEETILFCNTKSIRIQIPIILPLRGGKTLIIESQNRKPRLDKALIGALRKAHRKVRTERGFPVIHASSTSSYDRKIQRLAFLSPDIQSDIMNGLQPASLNLQKLMALAIPLDWNAQAQMLGWAEKKPSCSGEENSLIAAN